MSRASRRFKTSARRWNREHTAHKEHDFVVSRKAGSLSSYRAHRRRRQMYGEDIFEEFF